MGERVVQIVSAYRVYYRCDARNKYVFSFLFCFFILQFRLLRKTINPFRVTKYSQRKNYELSPNSLVLIFSGRRQFKIASQDFR